MEKDDYQLAKVFVLSVYFDESVSDLVSYSLALMLFLLCPWACLRHKKLRSSTVCIKGCGGYPLNSDGTVRKKTIIGNRTEPDIRRNHVTRSKPSEIRQNHPQVHGTIETFYGFIRTEPISF